MDEVSLKLPLWRYHAMYAMSEYSFLLDSATDPERLGRFSLLGGDPFLVYRAKRRPGETPEADIEVTRFERNAREDGGRHAVSRRVADPFDDLRTVLAEYAVTSDAAGRPLPLLSGAVGYFGYEAGYFIERLPDTGVDDLGLPDIALMFVDTVLGYCHESGRAYLSAVGRGPSRATARRAAERLRQRTLDRIRALEDDPPAMRPDAPPAGRDCVPLDVATRFDEGSYCRAVARIKEHILAGDIFEACMTHRFESPLVGGTAWELYEELRAVNPAPFASFLNFPEAQVVSSSPERYLSLNAERIAESRPIKGTRRRGGTPRYDAALKQDLRTSPKDRAENVMIVDLVRNDFGRVCKFGSIRVPELTAVEDYATVFQLVSTVQGALCDDLDALDLVRATFPGGSMTGAPKIEAMKILDRLEPVKRGIYSGAVGYLDFSGPLDLAMAIRTFVVKQGRCYYNTGGAVVADSHPADEYHETLDKAQALMAALRSLKSR